MIYSRVPYVICVQVHHLVQYMQKQRSDEKRKCTADASTSSNHPKQPTHPYKKHTDPFHRLPTAIPQAIGSQWTVSVCCFIGGCRLLGRLYKGVSPGSLYLMHRLPHLICVRVYYLVQYMWGMKLPTHNRYNGVAPGSLYIMNRAPYVICVQVHYLVRYM